MVASVPRLILIFYHLCLLLGFLMTSGLLLLQTAGESPLKQIQKKFSHSTLSSLERAIEGDMKEYFENEREILLVKDWIYKNQSRENYQKTIRKIIKKNCLDCHSTGGEAEFADLSTYEGLRLKAIVDSSGWYVSLLKKAHPHMLMIPLILFSLSMISFSLPAGRKWFYRIAPFPWVGVFLDIPGWFLVSLHASFSWMVLLGSFLFSVFFTVHVLGNLFVLVHPRFWRI